MARHVSADVWCDSDSSGSGCGLVVKPTVMTDDGDTVYSRNAASQARHTLRRRERKIARTLRLWPAYQDE